MNTSIANVGIFCTEHQMQWTVFFFACMKHFVHLFKMNYCAFFYPTTSTYYQTFIRNHGIEENVVYYLLQPVT